MPGIRIHGAAGRLRSHRAKPWPPEPRLTDHHWQWSRLVHRGCHGCWPGRRVSRPGQHKDRGRGGQLADPDECEYAHHREGHQPKPGIRGCGLLVGGDDGSPTAESQNVVPLMSTINTGAGAFGLFYGAARRIPSTTRRSAPSPRRSPASPGYSSRCATCRLCSTSAGGLAEWAQPGPHDGLSYSRR